jgi:putative acetyltransferase
MKTIETQRLILRGWRLADLEDLYEYARHPDVGPLAGWEPYASREESFAALKSFIEEDDRWAIVLKETGKVIGALRLYPDENRGNFSANHSANLINYVLSADYWGKGYMTEAVKRVVQYAFEETNTKLLSVFHLPHNLRSKRVIEKCGFQYEGTIVQGYENYDGQIFDSVCYHILKSEYHNLSDGSAFKGLQVVLEEGKTADFQALRKLGVGTSFAHTENFFSRRSLRSPLSSTPAK